MAFDENEVPVYEVPKTSIDQDAGALYAEVADAQSRSALQDKFESRYGSQEVENKAAVEPQAPGAGDTAKKDGGAPVAPAPVDDTGETSEADASTWWDATKAVISDVGQGLVEAPAQVVGGILSALDETAQALESIIPLGGIQITDPKTGELDIEAITPEKFKALETDFIKAITPDDADSVTGGFVRVTAQFLTGFFPALKGAKALGVTGAILAPAVAGAAADAVVFDPHEDRLSTFLNEIPALEAIVPDYLADNNPENESEWEGRLKNTIEGLGLGLAADGLFRAFKYYKAARNAKKSDKLAADPVGADVEAGKDALKEAARTELVQDVSDEALAPLGDPNGKLTVAAKPDETSTEAFKRIAEADTRAKVSIERGGALGKINAIIAKGKAAKLADPMDDALNVLRGKASMPKMPKRPVADLIKSLGGIDPQSSFAGEVRSIGITPKTHPGLFKKGGMGRIAGEGDQGTLVKPDLKGQGFDNIPISEHDIFRANVVDETGSAYIKEQDWLDGLEAEVGETPWRTEEQRALIEARIAPADELDEVLSTLGIDYENMSNAQVKKKLIEIAEEEKAYARSVEKVPEDAQPRSKDDVVHEGELIADADAAKVGEVGVVPQGKIFINHARINTPDDVKAIIQEMADADAVAINAKRGGEVVTNVETIKASSKEYQNITDLLGREPGPMTAAKATAARRLLVSSGEQIVDLAKKAQSAEATPADIYNFRRAMAVHYAIQSEVVAARTETARALQAWAIPIGATKARSQAITDLIMHNGGAGDIQTLAKMVSSVVDNPTALNSMARELGKGKFGKALYQVWINGLLSSPKTHAVNIMSNAMVATWSIPEKYLAAGISKVFYNGEIRSGEATARMYGLVKGIRDGGRLVYHGNKAEGVGDLSDVFDAFVKTDGVYGNDISAASFGLDEAGGLGRGIDMLGKFINAPGSALQTEDKFFKSLGYRMELQGLAYRQAASEGLEGKAFAERVSDVLSNPPESLKVEAIDAAHYQTFTNELGKLGREGQSFLRKTGVGKWVVPFVRTPTNIVKYTFERTPLAYMSGRIRSDIAAGGARAAQAHARVAMGSMVMLTVADMTMEGTITGRGPLDFRLQKIKRDTGWMPYSIKVGDRWYSYSRTDPIGMMIGIGADITEISSNSDEETMDMIAMAGVLALANNLANKTYMTGIYDFIGAIDPSNRSNTPTKYVQDFAGSMMPYSSFLRNTAGAVDPTIRQTKTVVRGEDGKIDEVATFLQEIVNKQKKLIPGLSDELRPMRDLYGEEITRASGIGWAFDLISPIASHVDNPDPVTQMLLDNKIAVNGVPRMIKGVKLNAEQYDDFAETAGKPLKEKLDELVADQGFQSLSGGPDGMKAEIVKDLIHTFRKAAMAKMLNKYPELQELTFMREMERAKTLQGN